MKNPWVVLLSIVVVLFVGAFWFADVAAERNNEGVTFSARIKGNPEANVKLVEYSDLECPACAEFQPYLSSVMEEYGDRLSLEYKHFPLPMHKNALLAARAAEAAAIQKDFFVFHDMVFARQSSWTSSANPAALFISYADELGLDKDQFKRHLNSSLVRQKVEADYKAARELGLTGTPTFFLNGEKMDFSTYEEFKQQIVNAINPPLELN